MQRSVFLSFEILVCNFDWAASSPAISDRASSFEFCYFDVSVLFIAFLLFAINIFENNFEVFFHVVAFQ